MLRSLEGSDSSVQGTNDDAQISKMSCTKAGYFKDEFIQYFVRRASRRSPLINRGYYSRHAALRQLLNSFLAAAAASGQQQQVQVLVLGAGFDTTWFQLSKEGGRAPYKCLEVDFKEVTQRKAAILAKEPALRSLLTCRQPPAAAAVAEPAGADPAAATSTSPAESAPGSYPTSSAAPLPSSPPPAAAAASSSSSAAAAAQPAAKAAAPSPAVVAAAVEAEGAGEVEVVVDVSGGRVLSPDYCLLPVDLRNIEGLQAAVQQAGLDCSAPTYILSECVLVYMEPQHSDALSSWAARTFTNALMAIYEQIRPDDAFGRQMVSNLELRGCPLRGLPATPTLAAHCARLLAAGWAWSEARDMDTLYRTFVDPRDKARVERLEIFDELEEWHMIQEHYCIALGRNDASGRLSGVGFGG